LINIFLAKQTATHIGPKINKFTLLFIFQLAPSSERYFSTAKFVFAFWLALADKLLLREIVYKSDFKL